MYVLCSEEEINVLGIDLIVIMNFKEEQDRGGDVWKQSKEGKMYARLQHMLKCETMTF